MEIMSEKAMFDRKKVWTVAEMGANHCQSFARAVEIVQAAANAGADAVKVQMFKPEEMTLDRSDWVIQNGPWEGMVLYDLYEQIAMPYDWVPVLKELAEKLGLLFFTSVYGPETVDIALDMGIEAFKIASFEVPYEELIRKVGKTKKTVIVSTGGSTDSEVWKASRWLYQSGCKDYWMLHCVSEYPAVDMNLRTLSDLHRRYQGKVGLSDHSIGHINAVMSVAYGARMIEKHLNPDGYWTQDAEFSVSKKEFARMVQDIRLAEKAEGVVKYGDGKGPFRRRNVDGRMLRTV